MGWQKKSPVQQTQGKNHETDNGVTASNPITSNKLKVRHMNENVKGIILFAEHLQGLEMLSPEQFKSLVLALFAESGAREEFPEMDEVTRLVFNLIVPSLHRAQEKMQRRAEASAENGKKGGRPKNPEPEYSDEKPSEPKKPTGFQVSDEKPSEPAIQNKTIQDKIKQEYIPPLTPPEGESVRSEPYSQEFEIFWQAYPKKVGKDAAYRAWKSKKREKRLPPLRELIPKVEQQKSTEQWQREGGRYVPNPATWLNQGRWQDAMPMQEEQAQDYSWLKDDD